MIVSEINLKSRQILTLHEALGMASGSMSSGDRFSVAGVLRRIRSLGDWDPELNGFRLLGPTEHDMHLPDGRVQISPEGTPAKGYSYSKSALKSDFPTIRISPEERGAITRALVALVNAKDNHCGGVVVVMEIAEWLGMEDALTNLVQPVSPAKAVA